jgi:aerobic C4-dicarboxylate transport protein
MGFLKRLPSSPIGLLICVAIGFTVGSYLPTLGGLALTFGQLYLALVNMAAIPLVVVATFFGLRQTMALPQPGKRTLMMLALATGLVVLSAFIGAIGGVVAGTGKDLSANSRQHLGFLVQSAAGEAANADVAIYETAAPEPPQTIKPWAQVIPDNFFRALAEGRSLGILVSAIVFGLAFAAIPRAQNPALMGVFEASYRAFEMIISRVNGFIPILAFGMAAYFAANTDANTLRSMGSFLGTFFAFAFACAAMAMILVWKNTGLSMGEVLSALKAPALISLTSASNMATIPDTIKDMSSKLGFSRGVVELVVPTASVFMRSGAALYFALLAVFVAHIYGQSIDGESFLLIGLGASLAAFASAGNNSLAAVGFAGMVLSLLNLPIEAALALFIAIDLICEGPRNLVTLMMVCVLIVLVSKGLPSERVDAGGIQETALGEVYRFHFSGATAVAALACSVAAAILITIFGIGVGMKKSEPHFQLRTAEISLRTVAAYSA